MQPRAYVWWSEVAGFGVRHGRSFSISINDNPTICPKKKNEKNNESNIT